MTPEENRSVGNLILLCLLHASQVDDVNQVGDFPVELLKDWKAKQLAECDQLHAGWFLSDKEVADVAEASFDLHIVGSNFVAQGGQAPGAGGAGGFAFGPGAVAGDGGSGGDTAYAWFRADELPDTVQVVVGPGGRGGVDGAAGEDGGDTSFGDLVRARGGKGGKGGAERASRAASEQPLGDAAPIPISVDLTRISVAMLANAAEVRNGLLFLLGGGWEDLTVPELPCRIAGNFVLIVELAGETPGEKFDLVLRVLDPEQRPVSVLSVLSVDVASAERYNRLPCVVPFAIDVDALGVWSIQVLRDQSELARVPFVVRQA